MTGTDVLVSLLFATVFVLGFMFLSGEWPL
jgi:hypothetical protein